ncbi:alpha/beta fold hydrolase [Planotetraspora sp. A-T 1434]|uniref:alpha/beta fold hydrolase n=1 Tax=Planotetraspora sp. A-T 1434 TaxID=2979219 RepID=UPI0021C18E60|nr:alpha/beta fold hydrolase [Planotetraspora sp. A-T 1434]MCT9935143.1 alpha/beta fold hydrolase [Planotetraspora sp. A-T 1434]
MNPLPGTAVVLLHALPLSSWMWAKQAEALRARGYRVIVPDLAGFGAAPPHAATPSLDLLADDLAHLLDEHDLEDAVLAGSSMGGYVALAFLRRYRQRVRGLALLGTRAQADTPAAAEARRAFAAMMLDDASRAVVVSQSLPRLVGAATREEQHAVLSAVAEQVAAASPAAVAWAQYAIADRPDSSGELAKLDAPVMVIAGEQDELVSQEEAAVLAALPPRGRLVTIPRSGHLQPVEAPGAVTEALLGLLAEVAGLPRGDRDRATATGDEHRVWGHTASSGLAFTSDDIVASHFAACASHYRAALGKVGIQSGWHVLDAGCGSGLFLPWLAELVGESGRISAIDLAPENAARAAQRAWALGLRGRADVRQADLLALPYADNTFDAVWCSNTTQYLDDADLARALQELARVVRPGGLVAIKDLAADLVCVRPGDPFLAVDLFRLAGRSGGYPAQLLRARDLHRRLVKAGLAQVWQETVLMEHYAPLSPAALDFYTRACAGMARQAAALGIGAGWEPFADPHGANHPLRRPDGYVSEGSVLAVGTVAR